jgi:hypothetical protein
MLFALHVLPSVALAVVPIVGMSCQRQEQSYKQQQAQQVETVNRSPVWRAATRLAMEYLQASSTWY